MIHFITVYHGYGYGESQGECHDSRPSLVRGFMVRPGINTFLPLNGGLVYPRERMPVPYPGNCCIGGMIMPVLIDS